MMTSVSSRIPTPVRGRIAPQFGNVYEVVDNNGGNSTYLLPASGFCKSYTELLSKRGLPAVWFYYWPPDQDLGKISIESANLRDFIVDGDDFKRLETLFEFYFSDLGGGSILKGKTFQERLINALQDPALRPTVNGLLNEFIQAQNIQRWREDPWIFRVFQQPKTLSFPC